MLLDDVAFGDGRTRLHRLPFSGLKLDRSLVERLPFEAHGRQAVRRLVRAAEARGQAVIAEGVSDRRIWGRALRPRRALRPGLCGGPAAAGDRPAGLVGRLARRPGGIGPIAEGRERPDA